MAQTITANQWFKFSSHNNNVGVGYTDDQFGKVIFKGADATKSVPATYRRISIRCLPSFARAETSMIGTLPDRHTSGITSKGTVIRNNQEYVYAIASPENNPTDFTLIALVESTMNTGDPQYQPQMSISIKNVELIANGPIVNRNQSPPKGIFDYKMPGNMTCTGMSAMLAPIKTSNPFTTTRGVEYVRQQDPMDINPGVSVSNSGATLVPAKKKSELDVLKEGISRTSQFKAPSELGGLYRGMSLKTDTQVRMEVCIPQNKNSYYIYGTIDRRKDASPILFTKGVVYLIIPDRITDEHGNDAGKHIRSKFLPIKWNGLPIAYFLGLRYDFKFAKVVVTSGTLSMEQLEEDIRKVRVTGVDSEVILAEYRVLDVRLDEHTIPSQEVEDDDYNEDYNGARDNNQTLQHIERMSKRFMKKERRRVKGVTGSKRRSQNRSMGRGRGDSFFP